MYHRVCTGKKYSFLYPFFSFSRSEQNGNYFLCATESRNKVVISSERLIGIGFLFKNEWNYSGFECLHFLNKSLRFNFQASAFFLISYTKQYE